MIAADARIGEVSLDPFSEACLAEPTVGGGELSAAGPVIGLTALDCHGMARLALVPDALRDYAA